MTILNLFGSACNCETKKADCWFKFNIYKMVFGVKLMVQMAIRKNYCMTAERQKTGKIEDVNLKHSLSLPTLFLLGIR